MGPYFDLYEGKYSIYVQNTVGPLPLHYYKILSRDLDKQAKYCLPQILLGAIVQYGGPARVNSDKRHGPKSSDSAQTK